ncbi:hypothetical protein Tco_0678886 [Tanacetum coccineum]|uniref:Uncharacterized protein n=1 Tax=Tanacetum coccineum TaxID=301880 RepID=A0ABQ4XGG1_9ASTR
MEIFVPDEDGDGISILIPVGKSHLTTLYIEVNRLKQCLLVDAGNDMEGNGTAFAGFPGLDLKTAIETAGDLGQISMYYMMEEKRKMAVVLVE